MASESNFQKALKFHQNGDLMNAQIFYQKAIELSDSSSNAYNNLGLIHFAQGNLPEAMKLWKSATDSNSNFVDPLVNLGIAHSQSQDFKNSIHYLEKATLIVPGRSDIKFMLAQAYSQTGNPDKAKKFLTPILKGNSPDPNAFLLSAQIDATEGDFAAAEKTLKELLKLSPGIPEAIINLGHLNKDQGNFSNAKTYFLKAQKENSNHFLANAELGRFLDESGETESGIGYLEKALKLKPNDWSVLVHLGNAKQRLGLFEEAIEAFRMALKVNPDDLGTRQNLSRVLTRFVPPWHLSMLADHVRNDRFEKAIQHRVHTDSIVLDIGAGSGILSMMAARHGAKQVYACETSAHIAKVAQEIIAKNGFDKKIKLFQKKSTQIKPEEIVEKPNLVVAEIFDAGLLGEMAIPTFRHAQKELVDKNCRIIPSKADVIGKLLSAERSASVNPMKEISGFDLSPFDQFRVAKEYVSENLNKISHEFLSDEFPMLKYDFENLGEPVGEHESRQEEIEVDITSDGVLNGVAFWFNLHLTEDISLSSSPERLDNHWGQALFFFENSMQVIKGDKVKLSICHNDVKIWFDEPILKKRQTTKR